MKWPSYTLDELGTVSRGRSRHRPRNAEHLYGGPFPFVQTGDVKAAALYLSEYTQTYSEAGLEQSKIWPRGTLCITIAANIAETAILDIDACFPDSIIGFTADTNKADARYIKYMFDAILKVKMSQVSQGAAQDNLSQEKLLSFKFPVPNLGKQNRIVSYLAAYDDLIENNNKRIALLEKSARLLYREWFVHFRFPGYKKTEFVNGLPKGWENAEIGKLTSKIGSGATPKGGSSSYKTSGTALIRSMNVYDINFLTNGLAYIDEGQSKKLSNVTVLQNDVLINITGASVGRCCIVPNNILPARVNQHVMIIRSKSKNCSPHYLLHSLVSYQYKEILLSIAGAGGATREALTKDTISSFKIKIPCENIMVKFTIEAEKYHSQIEVLSELNSKLSHARDLLLPRLMDGRIEVQD